jgi:GrpB-like predicted nucleotidyltransferase (UPF0157 family)
VNVQFEQFGIGMPNEEIQLSEHRADWARCYASVQRELLTATRGSGLALFHIGSTAIASPQAKIKKHIEQFYNACRQHTSLGNISPVEYEHQALTQTEARAA